MNKLLLVFSMFALLLSYGCNQTEGPEMQEEESFNQPVDNVNQDFPDAEIQEEEESFGQPADEMDPDYNTPGIEEPEAQTEMDQQREEAREANPSMPSDDANVTTPIDERPDLEEQEY